MTLKILLATAAAFVAGFPAFSAAQVPSDEVRGSAPPGAAAERPGEGAIRGGSILPGETGGMPEGRGATTPQPGKLSRCAELSGTLREQCLEEEHRAAQGSSRPPLPTDERGAQAPAPGSEPPPQRPPR